MKRMIAWAALVAVVSTPIATTIAKDGAAAPVDFSGLWQLRDDSKHVKPASLTPAALEIGKADKARAAAGQIVNPASRWCHPLGTPFIMGDSAPLDIAQSKYEVAIMAEVQSSARHLYIDGRKHPDMKDYDPTTNGNSVGHWEGKTLVVDTIGFSDRGVSGIPGGGHRGPNSHLIERYSLDDKATTLTIQFTWDDPGVFTQPHSYDFVYHRAEPGSYSFEYFCDASDPARSQN
jgi:hypothetical protein